VGRPLKLDSRLPRLAALVDHIESYLFPLLWPAYNHSLHADQWLYFGRISISSRQIQCGKKRYSWDKVERIGADSGYVVIELSGMPPIRLPVAQITNLELLLQLIEREIKP
jgi:hypothetical protein